MGYSPYVPGDIIELEFVLSDLKVVRTTESELCETDKYDSLSNNATPPEDDRPLGMQVW